MQPIPVEFFSGQGGTYYIPTLPSSASLLAYYDAGLTSSYVSGSSTWYDLSGNGYHATLTGSSPLYVTSSGASAVYSYSPALFFSQSLGYFTISSSLNDAFNPSNTTFPFGVCDTPPTYSSSGDWTMIMFATANGDAYLQQTLFGFQIGNSGTMKLRMQYDNTQDSYNILPSYGIGLIGGLAVGVTENVWNTVSSTKQCLTGFKTTNLSSINNPYNATQSVIDNSATYKNASQLLSGTGSSSIGSSWGGYIQAALLYNRILSPAELAQVATYFKYRKLN
jgi:hypothetical protein